VTSHPPCGQPVGPVGPAETDVALGPAPAPESVPVGVDRSGLRLTSYVWAETSMRYVPFFGPLEDYQLLAPNMAKKLRKANGNARK
jgi:hypothetical protein